MVRVWRGEDWAFGWHAELNKRANLGPVDRILESGGAVKCLLYLGRLSTLWTAVCVSTLCSDGRPLLSSDTSHSRQCPSSAPFTCTVDISPTLSVNAAYSLRSASSPLYSLFHGLKPATRCSAATGSTLLLFAPSTLFKVSFLVATGCKQLHSTKNTYCSLPAAALPHFAFSPVHLTAVAVR